MPRNPTAILVEPAVEVYVLPSSPQSTCSSSNGPQVAGLHIALTRTAMILHCILPMVWVVMPDAALGIGCLAAGFNALASRKP